MKNYKILVPTSEVKKEAIVAHSVPTLSGKTVGFVSNETWVCLTTIWRKLDEVLRAKYGVVETFKTAMPVTHQTPDQVLNDVATKCEVAILALAN